MATSPNYSWSEPDDTSFVKNGALAMRTLGNAIDSTVKSIDNRVTTAESTITSQGSTITSQGASITSIQAALNNLIDPFLLMGA